MAAEKPRKPQTSVIKELRRLIVVSGPWSYLLLASAVAGILLSIASVLAADLNARLTNSMLAGNVAAFTALILPVVLVRLAILLITAAQQYADGRFGQVTTDRLRMAVVTRLSRATAAAASKSHSGETLSRLTNDLGAAQNMLQSSVPRLFTGTVQAVLAVAYMLWKHWMLALVAIFGAPAVFMIVGRLTKPVMSLSRQGQEVLAEANEIVAEGLSGAEIVRSFGLQGRMAAAFMNVTDRWLALMRRYSRLTALAAGIGFGAAFTPFILIFGIGGFMVLKGQIEFGMLLAFMELLNYISFPMQELPGLLTRMSSDAASSKRVLDLLDIPVERQTGSDFSPDPSLPVIEFRNVTFTYPGAAAPALSGVSFAVRKGETVALAGASGSGKSTVFRLLLGDYRADEGEVLVFGHSLDEWSPESLRRHFSSVSQETYLFPFSIRENLRLGDSGLDDGRIQEAARLAQADDFIRSLPEGYDTPVGELGNRISGGERQRLSLARAFLRRAEVLLLDEATSALDYHSERQVIEAIQDTASDMTTLVIAHRLSSVQHADRILVFGAGRLVESGTHAELLAADGRYHQLYSAQSELDAPEGPEPPESPGGPEGTEALEGSDPA